MNRRTYLATATIAAATAGCTSDTSNGDGNDDGAENTDTATDTPAEPTPTPMPREAFSSIFSNRLDESEYPDNRGSVVGFEGERAYVKYYVTEDDHEQLRTVVREAYDAMVAERDVGRDLEGRVKTDDTREQRYTWHVEEAWAREFVDGEIDESEYESRIDETEDDW